MQVPTDSSNGIVYDWNKDVTTQVIATQDLSGCTVLVVASPFAVILVHIWERRDETQNGMGWMLSPGGPEQQMKDVHFVAKGAQLLDQMLEVSPGSRQDGFGGWFPPDRTTVNVVAPAANPAYDQEGSIGNPWYTYAQDVYPNPKRLIYKNAAEKLLTMAREKVIPGRGDQAMIRTYARRYSNDRSHGMDDEEYVILQPQKIHGRYKLHMMYNSVVDGVSILNMT